MRPRVFQASGRVVGSRRPLHADPHRHGLSDGALEGSLAGRSSLQVDGERLGPHHLAVLAQHLVEHLVGAVTGLDDEPHPVRDVQRRGSARLLDDPDQVTGHALALQLGRDLGVEHDHAAIAGQRGRPLGVGRHETQRVLALEQLDAARDDRVAVAASSRPA